MAPGRLRRAAGCPNGPGLGFAGHLEEYLHAPLSGRRPTVSRRHEESILKDIVELADRYDTPIRTALRLDIAPEDAILRQARLGHYDLIVMGVGRPAGETLYFGKIAAAVLENSQHSILFVSS